MSQLPSQEDDHNQGAMSKNSIIRCWMRCMRQYCSCLPCTGLNITFSLQSKLVYRNREICGSVEKYIGLYILSGLWLQKHSTRGAVGQAWWVLVEQEEVGATLISGPRVTLGGRHPISLLLLLHRSRFVFSYCFP